MALAGLCFSVPAWAATPTPIVAREQVACPTPQCHASTLVETRDGTLLLAWFGGDHEGANDVGIWLARREGKTWAPAQRIASGVDANGHAVPAWNPVLFQPADGALQLYYKLGPNPRQWWGLMASSMDDGRHWSAPRRLPEGALGAIKNKPVQLSSGRILSPSSTEDAGWRMHMEWSDDDGAHWQRTDALNDPKQLGAIQPSLLVHADGRVQALARTQQNRVASSWSSDRGEHWSTPTLLALENPNSGIDAVQLADGRSLLVYNPTPSGKDWWDGRGVLAVALSDDGEHWRRVLTLEDEPGQEFSYPAVIQTRDGQVHISYTWKRRQITHVMLDPTLLR
ncbi:Predicted neuraminidase (sialidase) [Pseudoxanthomonas sp. GM95]|uniref:sialidase family protein n=1 Tax=Pseudoxanthomonas sp. GM95 TaxID=1881043 RepID=UPI0008CAA639|nr:sialidase family protein [Pseudoxanthomonas sp. GM95]SEM37793.1 Predicted neuraminidase (sialidase) [Pseudoxanthomonas sp. GM95]